MLRKISYILLTCIISLNLSAQNKVDRFSDYTQMKGKEVKFYNAVSMAEFQGYYAYELVKEKPVLIKDGSAYKLLENNHLIVGDIEVYKKKRFLKVKATGKELYLILDKGFSYVDNIRSVVYWKEHQVRLSNEYQYLKLDSDLLYGKYSEMQALAKLDKYIPVKWNPVEMPKRINGEVNFICTVIGKPTEVFTFTVEEAAEHRNDFIDGEQFAEEKAEHERKLAEEKRKQEQRDSIVDSSTVFEARIKHTYEAENILEKHDITYEDDDADLKFSVYGTKTTTSGYGSYAKTKRFYKGFILTKDIELPEEVLVFKNAADKAYINRRGISGEYVRKTVAKENDMAYAQFYLDSLEQATLKLMEDIQKTYNFYKKNKVFILGEQYSYSDYKFGKEFKFFNCYNKDIKYVNMRIVAFNQVGDVQRDDIGNYAKDVRCIGPLEVGDAGVYDFDDLFWDDDDIIKELRVVELKITFSDNSVITFSGKEKVDKLRLSNYSQEEILK